MKSGIRKNGKVRYYRDYFLCFITGESYRETGLEFDIRIYVAYFVRAHASHLHIICMHMYVQTVAAEAVGNVNIVG